jgi:hypothetical protein
MKHLVKWLAALLLSFATWLPAVQAQTAGGPAGQAEKEDRVPGLQYTVAVLFTMLVLVIICTPSRKGAHE